VDYPEIMGHRGAAALAPENTLPGLDAAARAGCAWVEVDAMLSRDGVPVLHHDYLLKRTAGLRRRVETLTAAELAEIDVGSLTETSPPVPGATVPSLSSALRHMQSLSLHPNIEIKPSPGREVETAEAVVATVREVWQGDPPPLLSSFIPASLRRARDIAPDIPRALITIRPPRKWRAALEELQSGILHVSRKHLTAKRAEDIIRSGVKLGVYTVNEPAEARTFRSWGADCIITDAPDRVGPWAEAPLGEL
jgi:glycerophosphoryl diester phosphodiesterase